MYISCHIVPLDSIETLIHWFPQALEVRLKRLLRAKIMDKCSV